MKEKLFSGEQLGDSLGLLGLSNVTELVELCPDEFKKDNQWSAYALKIFFEGGNITNWKWKSEDKQEQKHQKLCFMGLLCEFSIQQNQKVALAGWMLSEMLTEVPQEE